MLHNSRALAPSNGGAILSGHVKISASRLETCGSQLEGSDILRVGTVDG